jgi:hypothetical protein
MEELEKVMEWKLCRGKDRPALRGLIKQNSAAAVAKASSAAFAHLEQSDWLSAIKAFAELRGVGPATASALLCVLPKGQELCPFMSDEVLEAATERKREYTLKAYQRLQEVLTKKASKLGRDWTAEKVGKACWTAGMLSVWETEVKLGSKKRKAAEDA